MNISIKFLCTLVCMIFSDYIFGYMPNQVEAFKKALQKPGQVVNCANCDFRGVQELEGIDAPGVFMPGVILQPCMPSSTNKNSMMICIDKQVANLKGINLSRATMFSSCLDGAILDKANLTGADVSNSSVQYVSLRDAIIKDMITTNSTFCNSIMPDGAVCKDTWTGQGMTIACNCSK